MDLLHISKNLLKDVNLSPFFVLFLARASKRLIERNKWNCKSVTGTILKRKCAQGILTRNSCNIQMPRTYVMFIKRDHLTTSDPVANAWALYQLERISASPGRSRREKSFQFQYWFV